MSIYVVGSINNDMVVTADRHPMPGETLMGTSLGHYPGGKGANQAVAAARAGAQVIMLGCTGSDPVGRELTAYLAASGVDISRVMAVKNTLTGTAIITVAQGENSILVIPGANEHLNVNCIAGISFNAEDVIVAQFETPVETTLAAFGAGRRRGARTILNPAPAMDIPLELIEQTDILVLNEHEFELLFEQPVSRVLDEKYAAPDVIDTTLVITLGPQGVLMFNQNEKIHLPGRMVEVVDSTGAGDCFVGYLAAALHSKQSWEKAVALANQAASISVTRAGAATSIPLRSEVDF